MFYNRTIAFHIIDRTIRLSDGCEVQDKHTDTLLDAYATSWVQRHGPLEVLYMDGESGLNNEEAKAELKRLGTELRIRAPGQHANLIEARNGVLRHVMHLIEEDLKRFGADISFKRLLGEGIFVCNAFTFYNGVSPYNAYTGRQPACLPDLDNIDFPVDGEQTDGERERRIRQAGIEAITQSTAVAKINRALKTQTTTDGSRLYKPGDLIDYHRPTATKDEHGGWNGPYPVVRNEPERGQVICKAGGREIVVQYPDARLTLYLDVYFTKTMGMDNTAMRTLLTYISNLPAGKAPEVFGQVLATDGSTWRLTAASRRAPKIHLALQYLTRNFFRVSNVVSIRLGKGLHRVPKCEYADGSVLIHYTNDVNPDFHYYETNDTGLDLSTITQCGHARIIHCLTRQGCAHVFDDVSELARELTPGGSTQ